MRSKLLTKTAFGILSSTVIGWLFLLWEMNGAQALPLVAASYVGCALGMNSEELYNIGFAVICSAFFVNFIGIFARNMVHLSPIISITLTSLISSRPPPC